MPMSHNAESRALFERALLHLPGGVNSPVRAFKSVGGEPRFIAGARGARMWDADGNEFIDYVGSWGPMILGHSFAPVVDALRKQLEQGTSFGAPTALEVEIAELVDQVYPSMEIIRMVNSGTEATMSAIRLARAATGRDKIIKFAGCYHGHGDSFLSKAGSGAATFGVPDSPGVPGALAALTLNARFNDAQSVEALFKSNRNEVAAVIVEPVCGNMGCVPPKDGFLERLRELCDEHGALLVFDEVMTGFRVAYGGAQERFNIMPDLTTLGKIIGGGLPVGAYGGRADLMARMAPRGPVYQAGTLSGNPLAMAAGLATLNYLDENRQVYDQLEKLGAQLQKEVDSIINANGWPLTMNRVGSMATLFFNKNEVECWDQASVCDTVAFGKYHNEMLRHGIYLPPSQYEAYFISASHTIKDIEITTRQMEVTLKEVLG